MATGIPTIVEAEARVDTLVVRFAERPEPLALPWRWVRDHSEGQDSFDQRTRQRLVDTFAIDPDVSGSSASLTADGVRVRWSDGAPDAELSSSLLADVAGLEERGVQQRWEAGSMPVSLPEVPHDAIMTSDDGVLQLLEAVDQVGFGIVRGMPTTAADAAALAGRIATPRNSIFGSMWSLSSDMSEHSDSAYSQTYLEPHTDGSYSRDAPGLQMFACLQRNGTGGESILVDGFAAADRLRLEDRAHFDLLNRVAVPGRYVEPGVHLSAERPTISLDPMGEVCQVTINNYDRAPFLLPVDEMEEWYAAYTHFHRLVTDRDQWLLVRLEPGDVLLFDNWRTLHGRMAYTGTRVFEGCYHNREDFESRLTVLRQERLRRADADVI